MMQFPFSYEHLAVKLTRLFIVRKIFSEEKPVIALINHPLFSSGLKKRCAPVPTNVGFFSY